MKIPELPEAQLSTLQHQPVEQKHIRELAAQVGRVISDGTRANVRQLQSLLYRVDLDQMPDDDSFRDVLRMIKATADTYCQLIDTYATPPPARSEQLMTPREMHDVIADTRQSLAERLQWLGQETGKIFFERDESHNMYGYLVLRHLEAAHQGDRASAAAFDAAAHLHNAASYPNLHYRLNCQAIQEYYLSHPRYEAVIHNLRDDPQYDTSEVDPEVLWELYEQGAIMRYKPNQYILASALQPLRYVT